MRGPLPPRPRYLFGGAHPILPHRGRWQRKTLTEGASHSTTAALCASYGIAVYIPHMSKAPVHTVIDTSAFTVRVKNLGPSADELASI